MDALGRSNNNMIATLLGTITRIVSLVIFSSLKIGLWGLVYAISLNIIITTLYQIKKVRNCLT